MTHRALALSLLIAVGCHKPATPEKTDAGPPERDCLTTLDETDLPATASCFVTLMNDGRRDRALQLFSKGPSFTDDQRRFSRIPRSDNRRVEFGEVLGSVVRDGTLYVRVLSNVRVKQDSGECTDVQTSTWVLENGRWRRFRSARFAFDTAMRQRRHEPLAVIDGAELWLQSDPFAISAWVNLAATIEKIGASAPEDKRHYLSEARDAVLGINAKDGEALAFVIAHAKDAKDARQLFDRLPMTSCRRPPAAVALMASMPDVAARLAFLGNVGPEDGAMFRQRIFALAANHDLKAVLALLTPETTKQLQESLQTDEPTYAAQQAASIGLILVDAEQIPAARSWLEFATARDTDGSLVRRLEARIFGMVE
jgi:hypothetical protein